MIVGMMHNGGKVVHVGKIVRVILNVKLYQPVCSKMQLHRATSYLDLTPSIDVTCKRCLAKLVKHPSLGQ